MSCLELVAGAFYITKPFANRLCAKPSSSMLNSVTLASFCQSRMCCSNIDELLSSSLWHGTNSLSCSQQLLQLLAFQKHGNCISFVTYSYCILAVVVGESCSCRHCGASAWRAAALPRVAASNIGRNLLLKRRSLALGINIIISRLKSRCCASVGGYSRDYTFRIVYNNNYCVLSYYWVGLLSFFCEHR